VEGLREVLDVPVETHDERLSSVSANRALTEAGVTGRRRRKARQAGAVDQAAATVFLQSWLDGHR
jgi:putative holliday junction resolvase